MAKTHTGLPKARMGKFLMFQTQTGQRACLGVNRIDSEYLSATLVTEAGGVLQLTSFEQVVNELVPINQKAEKFVMDLMKRRWGKKAEASPQAERFIQPGIGLEQGEEDTENGDAGDVPPGSSSEP